MDKNAIKKYAVWARRELISRVTQKALQYGITEKGMQPADASSVNGVVLSAKEKKQRQALIAKINDEGFEQVMEEVAYTWFNRFSALRFMEVNGYLPTHVRVFTDEENNFKPQILAEAINLEMEGLDMEKVYALKDANDNDTLFKYLLITQCNALSAILPGMFQKIDDYTELLFPDNLLREGSAIEQMIAMIPEEDWQDAVQIIGWLYQYYNIEPKASVDKKVKAHGKVKKEEVPAKTQLFTPDWIVRYMVENSLGRMWLEGHPNEELKSRWKYYLDETEQELKVQTQLAKIRKEYEGMKPEDIRCIDPCSGSGHILAYLFDVLVQIYEAYGYTAREAAASIVENNLYGLDIDDRAAQLANFAVMMKARQYDRRFFSRGIQPKVYAIVESNHVDKYNVEYFANGDAGLKKAITTVIDEFHDAKEYGSILTITPQDWAALYTRLEEIREDINISRDATLNDLLPLVRVAEVLAQKYDVAVTNPPYLGSSNMGDKINELLKIKYPFSKGDLFAVFIEKTLQMVKKNRFTSLITMQSWMFLSSYEKLRNKLVDFDIDTILHLGPHAFEELGGEVVQTVAFVMRNAYLPEYVSVCDRLVNEDDTFAKQEAFFNAGNRFYSKKTDYEKIPAKPYAYWISKQVLNTFLDNGCLGDLAEIVSGMTTGNNDIYLRGWTELDISQIAFGRSQLKNIDLSETKWIPYHKGGEQRKWYGNHEYVVNWSRSGEFNRAKTTMTHVYLKPCITWSDISGNSFAGRYCYGGFMFDVKGSCAFSSEENLKLLIGIFNSKITPIYVEALNPTTTTQVGDLKRIPLIHPSYEQMELIKKLVNENVDISKNEWDSFEFSWDYKHHPLVHMREGLDDAVSVAAAMQQFYGEPPKVSCPLELCYLLWQGVCNDRFNKLKANEEELNRIFIDIYGLQDEMTPEVEDKDVTVRKADLQRDIKSLISYAVGCMFGRYSLDVPGLAFAGGDWDACKYTSFPADKDNIIPICSDGDYFEDDIVGRFVKFIEVVYGKETLKENLQFIADALGGKGQPKEVIRNYFLNDFYNDHCKIYQKRPIYWQFDSGKKNGFKCLIYMHRYQPDTIARIRTDYVHEQQGRYRTAIADLEKRMEGTSTSDRVKLSKQLATLQAQAAEIHDYEEKIHHLADQYISIDLDDGVKVNYAKFQDVLAKIK